MAAPLVLAVTAYREVGAVRQRGEQRERVPRRRCRHLAEVYLREKAFHWAGVFAVSPSFIVSRLGASVGNHTSYQSWDANSAFGTPRGGRRTVPNSLALARRSRAAEADDANAHVNSMVG